MDVKHKIAPRFKIKIDRELCRHCKRCTVNCSFGVLEYNGNQIVVESEKCVACQ